MRFQTTQCVFLILLSVGLASIALADSPLRIRPTDDSSEGFDRVFSRQIDVFGLAVYATAKVPDEQLRHAGGLERLRLPVRKPERAVADVLYAQADLGAIRQPGDLAADPRSHIFTDALGV